MTDHISIMLADDHPVVRSGLKVSIEQDPRLRVVAEAADGEAALARIQQVQPQVSILDIDMPRLDGLAVARELQKLCLKTHIIFLTLHKDEDLFRAAMELGAKGYLVKDSAMQEIVSAVHAVTSGRLYLSSTIATHLLHPPALKAREADSALTAHLTPMERRIVRSIAEGKSSKEIGADLSVHYRTVENHRTNMCRKLGIEGAHALLRFAVQHKEEL